MKLATGFLALWSVPACLAEVPTALAIRDARVVTVSGPTLSKATVFLRDGLIEAVGENVAIPGDAWVIDGTGLTVYPGLIDALSTWVGTCRGSGRNTRLRSPPGQCTGNTSRPSSTTAFSGPGRPSLQHELDPRCRPYPAK
jgi:hypothetical protein